MERSRPRQPDRPFGIEAKHGNPGRLAMWRTPLAIFVIAGLIAAAFAGWLGGGSDAERRIVTPRATIELRHAAILRSGNWFETQVRLVPVTDVEDLVIAIDTPLWRAMSIDTLVPDAESAKSLDDRFAYHFGKVRAGHPFTLKFDGQIQPRAFRQLRGAMRIADGENEIATIPMALTVLP